MTEGTGAGAARPLRYHLAFSATRAEMIAANACAHPYALASYAKPSIARMLMAHHLGRPNMIGRGELIIDSGAFTAFTSGKIIDLNAFADYVHEFSAQHGAALARLECVNLDVIGDHDASVANWEALRAQGLNPIPVFTYGAPLGDLRDMASHGARLALGGLARMSKANQRGQIRAWLDACFAVLPEGVEVHLLGVGPMWVLRQYPVRTCDSTTFVNGVRFNKAAVNRLHAPEDKGHLKALQIEDEIRLIQKKIAAVNEQRGSNLFAGIA